MTDLSPVPNITTQTIPAPSKPLGTAGYEFWEDMHTEYDFTVEPDKLMILEQACKTLDVIDELEKDFIEKQSSYTATGSARQLTIHPVIAEIRVQRTTFQTLIKSLKLPENVIEQSGKPAPKASKANSRAWRA